MAAVLGQRKAELVAAEQAVAPAGGQGPGPPQAGQQAQLALRVRRLRETVKSLEARVSNLQAEILRLGRKRRATLERFHREVVWEL